MRPSLNEVVRALVEEHGAPKTFRIRDPWELVVWETSTYLADDEAKKGVFDRLKKLTALDPKQMVAAPRAKMVAALEGGGPVPGFRYDKLKLNAKRALEMDLKALRAAVKNGERVAAKKLLKRFHGIADPGSDRVLMFAGGAKTLGADAAIVRVLVRLGFGEDSRDWSRAYRTSAHAVEPELPNDRDALVRFHLALQTHGRLVCKTTRPACAECPLRDRCAHHAKSQASAPATDSPADRAIDGKVTAWERMWRTRARRNTLNHG
jgi:endonuclease III